MPGPLDGVRVLDLTRLAPGPFCTMILGDLGADVITIHDPRPPTGRRAEQAGAAGIALEVTGGRTAHNALRRNKRSIGLDLKDTEARELFYRLAREADVVVEEMRPGVTERLGVDYATLSALNPRLVYCAVTGYGQTGPYAKLAGHDLNYIGQAGALSLIGDREGRPVIPQNLLADYAGGGLPAALGVVAALYARERTGRGQLIDAAMVDGVVYLLAQFLSAYLGSGEIPAAGRSLFSGGAPFYDAYETKDGKYITIGSVEPWFYANLCRALGREDLIACQNDAARHPEIRGFLAETMRTRTREEWFAYLTETDQCVGRLLALDELEDDPQIRAREMIVEVDDPGHGGKVKQIGIAPKLSGTPGSVRRLPPEPGEHTREILVALGLSEQEIARLRERGAIG